MFDEIFQANIIFQSGFICTSLLFALFLLKAFNCDECECSKWPKLNTKLDDISLGWLDWKEHSCIPKENVNNKTEKFECEERRKIQIIICKELVTQYTHTHMYTYAHQKFYCQTEM